MTNRRQLEFFLLRYVPHAIRERYVDFGLILKEKGNEGGFVSVRFAPNWRGVLHLDPQADIEVLEALEREITGQLSNLRDREVLLRWIEDSYSNVIQLSAKRTCLAEDPEKEVELLASIYLNEPSPVTSVAARKQSGRQQILNGMQGEFERAGVWGVLTHGVPVADYTRQDDSFKFDFGYRLENKLKLFHGVSLKASVNAAIEMTSKYRRLAETKNDKKKFEPMLTAIVEDDLNRAEERVSYTLNVMSSEGIRVAELREMPGIAEGVRLELRV